MAIHVFRLPDLGEGLADADVVEWYVHEGDAIAVDQPLVSMESAKAVVEIPSPVAGRVARLCARPGETVPTGEPLVEIETVGAARSPEPAPAPSAAPSARAAPPADPATRGAGERVAAMPAVRARARALGVDLATVAGTGPDGRIRMQDVERAAAGGAAPAPADATVERLRGLRRAMAQAMARSGAEVVPVTVHDDADIDAWPSGTDVTARLVRALVAACGAAPALNAWLDAGAGTRTLHHAVHVGLAVDIEDGLVVPVLRDAQALDAAGVRAAIDRLRAGARARTLAPAALAGATVSLTNYGTLAGRHATPVVVPPQVAILGAGRARAVAVPHDGAIVSRRLLPLSLTYDHRACTGAEGARFLAAAIADLEA